MKCIQKNRQNPVDNELYHSYNTVKNCTTRIIRFAKGGAAGYMIDFEKIKLDQSQPIYSQLVDFVKQGLASGEIEAGDEMPSRRVLSALLGINPNTVQKAYAQLEAEELISSHSGAKSYVSATEGKVAEVKAELTVDGGKQAIAILKAAGYSKAEALAALERYWDAEGGNSE